jgi:hypothetical protein|tara:strand:+ start:1483 stop:1638 length:156 start_codon:yes stop_codon:yes gene_type:complete
MDVTDLKIYTLNATALGVSMTDIDIVLKIILLAVSIGYTIHKWYLLNGKNK